MVITPGLEGRWIKQELKVFVMDKNILVFGLFGVAMYLIFKDRSSTILPGPLDTPNTFPGSVVNTGIDVAQGPTEFPATTPGVINYGGQIQGFRVIDRSKVHSTV